MTWPAAFALTLLVEVPVYVAALRGTVKPWRAVAVALAVNAVTHPALWFLAPRFDPYLAWLATAELTIVLVEGALVARVARRRVGCLASLSANALSCAVGLALSA